MSQDKRQYRYQLQHQAGLLLPKQRVASCATRLHWNAKHVDVNYSADDEKASYGGLQFCGSVWHCPVCAVKITEQRRAEIATAVQSAIARDYSMMLLTLTASHAIHEPCKDVTNRFVAAQRYMRQKTGYRSYREHIGEVGFIKSLEVTYGENGFHPHSHSLVFIRSSATSGQVEEWQERLRDYWVDVCAKRGMLSNRVNGLTLELVDRSHEKVVDYIAKQVGNDSPRSWTVSHEVAKSVHKTARPGSRSMWQLLEDSLVGDTASGKLFQEYAKAFKGKRHIIWSDKLRAHLLPDDADELDDDELVHTVQLGSRVVACMSGYAFGQLVKLGLRLELLERCEEYQGDFDKLHKWAASQSANVQLFRPGDSAVDEVGDVGLMRSYVQDEIRRLKQRQLA